MHCTPLNTICQQPPNLSCGGDSGMLCNLDMRASCAGKSGPNIHLAVLSQPQRSSASPRGTQTAFRTRRRPDLRQLCSALLLLLCEVLSWRTPQLPRQRQLHLPMTLAPFLRRKLPLQPMPLQPPAPLAPSAACSALPVPSAAFCKDKKPCQSQGPPLSPSQGEHPMRTGTSSPGLSEEIATAQHPTTWYFWTHLHMHEQQTSLSTC